MLFVQDLRLDGGMGSESMPPVQLHQGSVLQLCWTCSAALGQRTVLVQKETTPDKASREWIGVVSVGGSCLMAPPETPRLRGDAPEGAYGSEQCWTNLLP